MCIRDRDIYHHPKNRFVADFIGIANITEANVKNIGDNLYAVSSIFGDFTVFSEKKPESERIYICFRPEDIELLPNAQTEAENQITVDIINTAFMGNITEAVSYTHLHYPFGQRKLKTFYHLSVYCNHIPFHVD